VNRIAKRFEYYVPFITGMITEGRYAFPPKSVRHSPHGLKKIDDAKVLGLLDDKCVAVQLAAQVNLDGSFSNLYLDDRLYKHPKHSALSRGVLALHEFVYRKARQLGQTDSHNTRKLVGFLIKKNLGHSVPVLIAHLTSLGFATTDSPALSYRGTLLEKVASALLGNANMFLSMGISSGVTKLIARANSELSSSHKSCEPGFTLRAAYACQDIVESVEGHKSLKAEFVRFFGLNEDAVRKTLDMNYTNPDHGWRKWIGEQPGLSQAQVAELDRIIQFLVLKEGPLVVYRAMPKDVIPIEEKPVAQIAHEIAVRSENFSRQDNVIIP
jgi:hypothetical protein